MILFESWLGDIAVVLAVLSAGLYYLLTSSYDYWKKRNVPYITPSFPFGNFGNLVSGKVSVSQLLDGFYKEFKHHGFGGIYNLKEPGLVVCDPELIKHFLTKDFSSFHDRGIPYDEDSDPFSANLFNLGGTRWKVLRAKLTPTFTSGKIKGMVPLIQECSEELKNCIRTEIEKNNGSVELRDLLVRFAVDVIGSCAFGISCNSLKDKHGEFYEMGRGIGQKNVLKILRFVVIKLCPSMVKYFTFKRIFAKRTDFFSKLMSRTVQYRKENNVERNDFVQLMMKIIEEDSGDMVFNQDIMTAQAFLFFTAGLDNVANNIGFCLHALALHPYLQERVYQEITRDLADFDGELCYEAVGKMDLLSRVIDEGMRLYTPAGVLARKLTGEKYVIPGTNIELEKGTEIMIPIHSLHHDEEYFPNPRKFDPDRFLEDEKAKRHPYTYLPFGEGPRFCIASRFAQLEMRLCLAEMVRNFSFSVAPETDLSLDLDVKAFGPTPKNGFWLKVAERL